MQQEQSCRDGIDPSEFCQQRRPARVGKMMSFSLVRCGSQPKFCVRVRILTTGDVPARLLRHQCWEVLAITWKSAAVTRNRPQSPAVARNRQQSLAIAHNRPQSAAVARSRPQSPTVGRSRSQSLSVALSRPQSPAVARARSGKTIQSLIRYHRKNGCAAQQRLYAIVDFCF